MSLCLRPQQVRTEPVLLPLSRVPGAAQKVGPGAPAVTSPHALSSSVLFWLVPKSHPIKTTLS